MLGSAQWGMNYGISNTFGKTSKKEVNLILKKAIKYNIKYIDTAPIYGSSEIVIGDELLSKYFNIGSKIPEIKQKRITKLEITKIEKIMRKSLRNLKKDKFDYLLMHNPSDCFKNGGEKLLEFLCKAKELGLTKKIGFSAYDEKEIEKIMSIFSPDLIQLPVNIFDQRLINNGTLKYLKDSGIEIHSRSVFLQGLLLLNPYNLPVYFEKWKKYFIDWFEYCKEKEVKPQHLALKFCLENKLIDKVIIGIQNSFQLEELFEIKKIELINEQNLFSINDENLLNPSKWRL